MVKEIDILQVLVKARVAGYRLLKSEVGPHAKYVFEYDESFYKISLIDLSYNIIATAGPAKIAKKPGRNQPMTIITEIGLCMIMPVRCDKGETSEDVIVIKMD
jgi:hypothetical protein